MKVGNFLNIMITLLIACASLYIVYRKSDNSAIVASSIEVYVSNYDKNMTFSDLEKFL